MVNPPTPRAASTRESILRGRDLFLGKDEGEAGLHDCHGAQAQGDGKSFVTQEIFNHVVFGGNPSERQTDGSTNLIDKMKELWRQKLDEWGNPLRPNNLKRGVYKGGRRPHRHLLADRQGDHRGPDARRITRADQRAADLGPGQLRAGQLPYEPGLLKDAAAACPPGDDVPAASRSMRRVREIRSQRFVRLHGGAR